MKKHEQKTTQTYSLAIDLGGTTAKCALIRDAKMIEKILIPTKIGNIIENIYDYVAKMLLNYQITTSELAFIGMTVCGLLDYQQGISVWAGNLQWKNYPVLATLKKFFQNTHIYLLNDAKAAAYGEFIFGIKQEKPNMLLYTIGTGLGGGVILKNQIYFETNYQIASEPGHGGGFQNEYECNCGLQGCVEGTSSATGIEKTINQHAAYFETKLKRHQPWITIKDVAPLLIQEDAFTLQLFAKALQPLCQHIAVSQHLMNFDIISIGGGPSALGAPLLNILKTNLKPLMLPAFYNALDLRIATLGNDAAIWGVYQWAKEHALK